MAEELYVTCCITLLIEIKEIYSIYLIFSDSSLTDTLNDRLSEGQWLLSRSEGQMAPIPITDAVRHEYLRKRFHNPADVSGASTLRDTDDLDLDEDPRSEGEFLHKGD